MPDWGQGLQGAGGGALAGGGIGGLPGALVGGGLGFLGGLFGGGGSDEYRKRLMEMEKMWANRPAPQAGASATASNSDFRGNQAALIAQLEALSRGQGPSLAALQMREAMDRAASGQNAMAAGATRRGVSAGAALHNASNQAAGIQSQGARDTAMARVGEQLGALQQLGLTVQGARGLDETNSRFNAAQANQTALANLDAQLRAMGMNDQARLQALQAAMGGAGPGMGTQILAGGASMFPYLSGQRAAGQQGGGTNSQGINYQNLYDQYAGQYGGGPASSPGQEY